MWKYAIVLSYVGTRYCGWQKQLKKNGEEVLPADDPSIQTTFENMLERMTGERGQVVGSGRTDSGVHAIGQVVHFTLKKKEWDLKILHKGLNSLLPRDIQVLKIARVPIEFHAQRSAERKQYSYYFLQAPTSLPHLTPVCWWIRKSLDVDSMHRALQYLVGERDFKPFQASGAKPGPTVRRILEADVTLVPVAFPQYSPASFVRVRVMGTGFLKQMVRGISGTLLQVGDGRRSIESVREILVKQDRSLVGPTAPGRGLWLERVWYPLEFGFDSEVGSIASPFQTN